MRFKLTPRAKKYLQTLNKDTIDDIYENLRDITKEPPLCKDIKQLEGANKEYRLRIGDYRVLFEIINGDIVVNKISPRGSAYKK